MQTLFLAALIAFGGSQEPAPEKIPVLILSGANNHDWEWTTPRLRQILENSGRFEVSGTQDPGTTLADADMLARFAAFVLDYNGPRWGDEAEANFLAAVRGGTGVVVLHAANNAFPGWTEYEELVALCWRDGTGHGSFHPFEVKLIDRDHPVTRGLPPLPTHNDELYHDLAHMHDAPYRVLGTAFSDPETGGTGDDEPMILVKEYGEGRVFHTPLGHVWRDDLRSRASYADRRFQMLVVRGTEWAATGEVTETNPVPNYLTEWEKRAGWRLLFDGQSTDGWHGYGDVGFPERGWSVSNGALKHAAGGGGGDIVSDVTFTDFELDFEWMAAPGANSGVKYRFEEDPTRGAPLGPEYQILDDEGHRDGAGPKTSVGALYAVYEPIGKPAAPAGAWNRSRIVSVEGRIEHWLNGVRVVEAEVGADEWTTRVLASKFSGGLATYGKQLPTPIALQDHGDLVWFRSLRVRDRSNPPGELVTLFDGKSLAGWKPLGDAIYEVDEGSILGRIGGGGQSFLASERTFSDFILELEVKTEEPGNSGLQIRSRETDSGRLVGYQIEIDPSERSWSGGLFYEGEAWMQNLERNPHGRAAYRHGEWNRFRVECVGPTIKAWVNGVPTTTFANARDAEGVIGLQVHSGNNTRVRWRDIRLWPID